MGTESNKLRVLTLNCWGIPYVTKECTFRISSIAEEISKGTYDVIALQEIWTEQQYQEIKTALSDVLPYSHYFYSGCIGTGLCTFSKYKIVNAFLHQFAINGQFYAIMQGDWFAGKGVGCCVIKHPRGLIRFFNSHLHADYPSNLYTELRTLQAYQCAQFIESTTRPGDTVIMCGDFNHEDTEIGVKALKLIAGLKDAWRTATKRPPGPCYTINTEDNPYAETNETTKRIDFVLHSDRLQCIESGLDLEGIPETKHHFSDHKGVTAIFQFKVYDITIKDKMGCSNLKGIHMYKARSSTLYPGVALELFNRCARILRQEIDEISGPKKSERQPREGSEKILEELQDTIAYGLKLAEEYKWTRIIPICVILFMLIFMPVLSADGIYFMLPLLNSLSGDIVFFIQTLCVVLSVSYFWNLLILKKIEQNAYKNAMLEIQFKLDMARNHVKNDIM